MNVKILFLLMAILAASLALVTGLLQRNHNNDDRAPRRMMPDTDCAFSSGGEEMAKRSVIIAAKRLMADTGNEDALERKTHIPRELESWLEGLRRQLTDKVEGQNRGNDPESRAHPPAGRMARQCRMNSPQDAEGRAQDDPNPEDYPFLLWRELQLRGDNSLVVNMLLVNNRREGQSRGVIVSQIIPEGWSLSGAWPDIQACDAGRREVKWLFAEAASRRNWILQVVLTPGKQAEIPLLPEENTTLRCCLPGGSLMQYACTSLP